jgi:hypothetical protein
MPQEAPRSGGEGELDAASTVLVLSSGIDSVGVDTCADLLVSGATEGPDFGAVDRFDRLVVVTVGESTSAWHARLADAAVPVEYVDVRTLARSTSAADGDADAPRPAATVSSPADLGSLGTALLDILSEHDDERIGLCLYSLTEMLQFVDREFLFKFLFTFSKRLRSVDAVAFYHAETEVCGDELETLFSHCVEAVLTVTGEEPTVEAGRYGAAGDPA